MGENLIFLLIPQWIRERGPMRNEGGYVVDSFSLRAIHKNPIFSIHFLRSHTKIKKIKLKKKTVQINCIFKNIVQTKIVAKDTSGVPLAPLFERKKNCTLGNFLIFEGRVEMNSNVNEKKKKMDRKLKMLLKEANKNQI